MIINKNAWHYHVYEFSYALSRDYPPSRTNLCQYMRRIMFVAPFVSVLLAVLLAFATMVTLIGVLFMPIFGYVPTKWAKPWYIFEHDGTRKYQGLKLGRSYNAFQVYPWHIILLALIVAIEWVVYHYFGVHPLVVQGEIVGVILALVGIVVGLFIYFDSSTGKVINEYLAAKKQKVCPVVEFKNEEQSP